MKLMGPCLLFGVLAILSAGTVDARSMPGPTKRPPCHHGPHPCDELEYQVRGNISVVFSPNVTAENAHGPCPTMPEYLMCLQNNLDHYMSVVANCRGGFSSAFANTQVQMMLLSIVEIGAAVCLTPAEEVASHLRCIVSNHQMFGSCFEDASARSGLRDLMMTRKRSADSGYPEGPTTWAPPYTTGAPSYHPEPGAPSPPGIPEVTDGIRDTVFGAVCNFLEMMVPCMSESITSECGNSTGSWAASHLWHFVDQASIHLQCHGDDPWVPPVMFELY